ncbi:restriction endonuclease subunit S [Aquisalimonas sp. APHAB1-3]|uniref:restriction endonuclease subunit S n=1 Tax=Aquisalimonas sp. APHAB1-3 TaxID=3402080 RepID=UPI003AAE87A9
MSYPSYPEYAESGIKWVGAIPAYWETWKISHAFKEIGSGTTPPSNEADWYTDGTIPWVTTSELRENTISDTQSYVTKEALARLSSLRVHPPGSLLIAMYGATIGRMGVLGVHATTNQACCALSSPIKLDPKYTFYWFSVFKAPIIEMFATGGGQPNINQETIASIRIPAPPISEQTQIARFLDHETARIDALIAEQQRLIELLKEKRQAVISHAVTKGLDPDVPMRDSGVEWFGELPAHWQVKRLKHITSAIGGSTPSKDRPEFWDGSIPWVSPKDMKVKVINQTIDQITEEAVLENNLSLADPGMVLVVVRGMILAHSLPLAITASKVALNQDMKALKTEKFMDSEYLFDLLSGIKDVAFEFVDSSAHGTRRLEWERFREILLPIPPLSEQRELSYRINAAKGQIDQLSQEAQKAIGHLQERRSALISATVTGKIDVRDWLPPTSEAFGEATVSEGATA